ncbi:MAG: VWA domain-containing protein [Candidatus Sericytochromatia bacterium]|nr:VWA domain-containing protein [Candidatus Sericytochromatia bacterium]
MKQINRFVCFSLAALSLSALSLSACGPSPSSVAQVTGNLIGAHSSPYSNSYYSGAYPVPSATGAPGSAMSLPGQTTTNAPTMPVDTRNESYQAIAENPFLAVLQNPLSTFSIDVDTASYSNLRRYLNQGQKPPKDAVRIEEMLNYFRYDYPQPEGNLPFAISTELSECPWNKEHQLLQIGLQAKSIDMSQAPRSNLVFLLDVSGSMASQNKLPLLKQSLRLMVDQLRPDDTVSIVVYAGAAGQVLPPTTGRNKENILKALDQLEAGGSTAGGAGIHLAYETARQNFIQGGNNRVILATDGDFNVGASSDSDMERLIENKRKEGVFLTVLGFGMGNYKDSKMEILANKGNGNYAYIDSLMEARKVLVKEIGGTLFTVAKDVKLQLDFNPAHVSRYRLIGYENRLLRAEDFNNDAKDAGELGAGHTVTALYELEPGTGSTEKPQTADGQTTAFGPGDLINLKLRYKNPNQDVSELISQRVSAQSKAWSESSENLRFAASVAGFGLLLRDSAHKGNLKLPQVKELGLQGKGSDKEGYRQAYLNLLDQAAGLGL